MSIQFLNASGEAFTVLTYIWAAMSEGGGSYVITYGFMLAGGGDMLYGLVGWIGELQK